MSSPVPCFAAGVSGYKSVLGSKLASVFNQNKAVVAAGAVKSLVGLATVRNLSAYSVLVEGPVLGTFNAGEVLESAASRVDVVDIEPTRAVL